MHANQAAAPDSTAIRVALWRALHVEVDDAPHVLEDETGLQIAAPDANWRERPDMHPQGTRGYRASIVGRARFVEDLVAERTAKGEALQYAILGAGLDTFAQRHPDIASRLQVYEVDKPGPQAWKRRRLVALGYRIRRCETCGDRVHGRFHVSHARSESRDAAANRAARTGLRACHDVPLAAGSYRRARALAARRRVRARARPARRS